MKTENEIRAQRDWFWVLSEEMDRQAEAENSADKAQTALEFAVVVGTLDWVLNEVGDVARTLS